MRLTLHSRGSSVVSKFPRHVHAPAVLCCTVCLCVQVIRELLGREGEGHVQRYVIVVEHDLSVLDYLSDFICCLYGKPGAYGVVTLPFSVREGINIFLAGTWLGRAAGISASFNSSPHSTGCRVCATRWHKQGCIDKPDKQQRQHMIRY